MADQFLTYFTTGFNLAIDFKAFLVYLFHEIFTSKNFTILIVLEVLCINKEQYLNPLRPKSHYSGSDSCKRNYFFKKCVLKPSTQTAIFSCMNGLLLHGFQQITGYTYVYNIMSYLNTFYYFK